MTTIFAHPRAASPPVRARVSSSPLRDMRKSPPPGVATLPTIKAHEELQAPPSSIPLANGVPRRRRRSSSIKQKPPPGVVPVKVVDWEIPRKAFHSSIGLVTLLLHYYDPPTLRPLITYLSIALCGITTVDLIRLRFPAFAELWESVVGFLMREEERGKINGVVWYLVGVIFVLSAYPRDIAVASILILAWADTTASTLGRLWGRYTPPLPSHFLGLPFAPRKSLAGFLAATVTGMMITICWWHNSTDWAIFGSPAGLALSAVVIGTGGAVVEALDLGVDDNLTLPILSGAVIWAWLAATNLVF